MKYLFLIHADVENPKTISESEGEAFNRACLANDEVLWERGYLLFAVRLQDDGYAATVQVQNGELSLTSGPFSPTEAQLVGVFLISARDLNEALRLAARMPQARRGPIEVRSALKFGWPNTSAR